LERVVFCVNLEGRSTLAWQKKTYTPS